MLGSCFADEMGEQMHRHGLHVTSNPFGTLYNPLSIAQAINLQISESSNLPMINHDGLWHSMAHHGAFSRPNKEDAEQAVRGSIEAMQNALAEATVVIVTFGSAWVYEMEGQIVANCHKMPESRFTRRRLSVNEIVEAWRPIVDRYPDKRWLFTVSPIRHIRDEGRSGGVSYFPSYEIVLDELRDYRFYADDLVHPSALAVNYIWERFTEVFCTPQTRNQMQIEFKRWKQDRHIPLH